MINTKNNPKYPTIQVRSQELRDCFMDFAQKHNMSMNEAVYKILKAFAEMEGYTDIPDFKGMGGFNIEFTPEQHQRLKEQAIYARTFVNKKSEYSEKMLYPQGRYLLEKYNENLQYQSDDIQIKRLTVEDIAEKIGETKEAIKRYFWIMPIAESKVDKKVSKKIARFFRVKETELFKHD